MAHIRTRRPTGSRRSRAAGVLAPRKEPSQDRARHTVEAILQAAAAVLAQGGYDKASTNRIAEAAGVSIGSLYQYFPSKEAVVKALVERHEQRMLGVMRAHLSDVASQDIPTIVRALIDGLLDAHRVDPRLQKVLLEHSGGHTSSSIDDAVESLVRTAMETKKAELDVADLDAAAFILVTSVRTVCHRAAVERPDLLARSTFVDELNALVVRYVLRTTPSPKRPSRRR
ncbi:MAG: TetR family transcriptional regulator [Polyangiaceae bacterium]|nr:TetR family transcriptional regulator [Polyangiaceae bacterium]